VVAAAEPDSAKAALFKGMAVAAEEQAGILAKVGSGWSLSALPPKADIRQRIEHVCFVP
jgi:hypothetical protein